MSASELHDDPRFVAIVDLLRRTGAATVEIRFSEGEDGAPTCWLAVAEYAEDRWDCAGATGPLGALVRLAEQLIDGGTCRRCGRPTSFVAEGPADVMDVLTCAFIWEAGSDGGYVRTCERAARS